MAKPQRDPNADGRQTAAVLRMPISVDSLEHVNGLRAKEALRVMGCVRMNLACLRELAGLSQEQVYARLPEQLKQQTTHFLDSIASQGKQASTEVDRFFSLMERWEVNDSPIREVADFSDYRQKLLALQDGLISAYLDIPEVSAKKLTKANFLEHREEFETGLIIKGLFDLDDAGLVLKAVLPLLSRRLGALQKSLESGNLLPEGSDASHVETAGDWLSVKILLAHLKDSKHLGTLHHSAEQLGKMESFVHQIGKVLRDDDPRADVVKEVASLLPEVIGGFLGRKVSEISFSAGAFVSDLVFTTEHRRHQSSIDFNLRVDNDVVTGSFPVESRLGNPHALLNGRFLTEIDRRFQTLPKEAKDKLLSAFCRHLQTAVEVMSSWDGARNGRPPVLVIPLSAGQPSSFESRLVKEILKTTQIQILVADHVFQSTTTSANLRATVKTAALSRIEGLTDELVSECHSVAGQPKSAVGTEWGESDETFAQRLANLYDSAKFARDVVDKLDRWQWLFLAGEHHSKLADSLQLALAPLNELRAVELPYLRQLFARQQLGFFKMYSSVLDSAAAQGSFTEETARLLVALVAWRKHQTSGSTRPKSALEWEIVKNLQPKVDALLPYLVSALRAGVELGSEYREKLPAVLEQLSGIYDGRKFPERENYLALAADISLINQALKSMLDNHKRKVEATTPGASPDRKPGHPYFLDGTPVVFLSAMPGNSKILVHVDPNCAERARMKRRGVAIPQGPQALDRLDLYSLDTGGKALACCRECQTPSQGLLARDPKTRATFMPSANSANLPEKYRTQD